MSSRGIVLGPDGSPARAVTTRDNRVVSAGGGAVDPYAAAESNAFGIFDFEDASHYVTGSNGLYQMLDQSASGHLGTISSRSGVNGDTNTVVAGSGAGTGYARVTGANQRIMWMNGTPGGDGALASMTFVCIFRTVGASGTPQIEAPWSHNQSAADRPWFKWNNGGSAGTWQFNNGVSSPVILNSSGTNVSHTVNPADNNWHCLAVLNHTSAGQGLMLDLDGQQLILDESTFSWTDCTTARLDRFSAFSNDIDLSGGGGTNITTMDIGAFAWVKTWADGTKAQVREIASGLMSRWGITNLAA